MPRIRRRPPGPDQQLDFFVASLQPTPYPAPVWSDLPDQAQQVVTGLMTRLLIAHAGGAGRLGSDGDER